MLKAIRHGLGNLLNGRGRDARQAFWYYVLFVYVVMLVISMAVVVPLALQAVFTGIQKGIAASQAADPLAAQAAAEAAVVGSMSGMLSTMLWIGVGSGVLTVALLGAAFVRRLHDSGLSGYWALIPGAIYLANLILMPSLMQRMLDSLTRIGPGDPVAGIIAMQSSFGIASLLGWAVIVAVVLLGVRKSTPGPNRFGEAPFVA